MALVRISYSGKSFALPRSDVKVSVISSFFAMDTLGLHLKVFRENGTVTNAWPDAVGNFSLPPEAKSAEVVGFQNDQEDEEDLFQSPISVLSTRPGPSRSTPRPLSHRPNHCGFAPSTAYGRISASNGPRIPPGLRQVVHAPGGSWKGKKKALTKDVMYSKPNPETGYPDSIFPVTINLDSLTEITVETVAEAVENMLGNGEPLLILNTRGDLIQDMSTTRGPEFWSRQKVFRAMSVDDFQKWRPDVWQHVSSKMPGSSPKETSLEKSMDAMDKLNTIDDKLNMLLTGHNNENRDSVSANFKCLICLEIQCSTMFFCVYGCGRFVGCFTCCYRLSKCPNCRKNFPGKGIRKPMIVPGLAKSLKLPELSKEEFDKKMDDVKNQGMPNNDSEASDIDEDLTLSSVRNDLL